MAASKEGSRRSVPTETLVDGDSPSPLDPVAPRFGLAHIGCCDTPASDTARMIWLDDVSRVLLGRGADFSADVRSRQMTVGIPDGHASQRHARIHSDGNGWLLRDTSRNGTRVGGTLVGQRRLVAGDVIETGHTFWRFVEHVPRHAGLATTESSIAMTPTRTISPRLVEDLAILRLAAGRTAPLLLLGPSGSGKEFLARQVHEWSGRRGGYHAFNCAAVPETLAEDALFGHKRGAFYGADTDRAGMVEAAAGGTLLLDEIGDLSSNSQARLLRVIGEHEVTRIGDDRSRRVDVRFVAATNRDLAAAVRDKTFRGDLFARFDRPFPGLPPLCDRREDLGILIAHLLRCEIPDRADALAMEPAAYRRLLSYTWPYNIRELRQALAYALLVSGNAALIKSAHLRFPDDASPRPDGSHDGSSDGHEEGDGGGGKKEILAALETSQWRITAAARLLKVHRNQVYRLMRRHGLRRPRSPGGPAPSPRKA